MMKKVDEMEYFPPAEKLVNVLMQKTQNSNPLFFRVLVAYYFTKIASMMRTDIKTPDRGVIPVSMYAMNLASSGQGKGHSTNIIEDQVLSGFKEEFLEFTFPVVSSTNLAKIATKRAIKNDIEPEEALELVEKEFESLGALAFSFDSGTTAAVKQMRHKLLMANAGSVNFEMDEIGSNLLGNADVLSAFLELFDVGKIKQKLTKNTADNKRSEEIEGRTPTNLLLFGTPAKLLDGEKVEAALISMFETGYARRCFFGFSADNGKRLELTPEEVYDMMTDKSSSAYLVELRNKLAKLADSINFHTTLTMTKDVSLKLIEYKLACEKIAHGMKDHEDILKAEIAHRYYKVLKLAGTYAFISESHEITEEHIYNAIKLAEDSGAALTQILTRERNYQKLAKYIANVEKEVTQVDLIEDLPFYRGSESSKKEMMTHAIAYGYKNNIIIKRTYSDGIEFLQGESLKATNLAMMTVSYGTDIVAGFQPDYAPFDSLHKVVTLANYHYTAHHFKEGYRAADKAIPGFNLVIIDVDDGVSLESAKLLLDGYKCMFATTKSHTDSTNRFRIIFPLSHVVKLTPDDYSKFMTNVFNWLPFTVDTATKDIARKWVSHPGSHEYQDGALLDAMLFIPQTKKEEEFSQKILDHQSMSNLERWIILNTTSGNRSNQMIKYALALVDGGNTIEGVRNKVMSFNEKLKDGLSEDEINTTIMITVTKAVVKRDS